MHSMPIKGLSLCLLKDFLSTLLSHFFNKPLRLINWSVAFAYGCVEWWFCMCITVRYTFCCLFARCVAWNTWIRQSWGRRLVSVRQGNQGWPVPSDAAMRCGDVVGPRLLVSANNLAWTLHVAHPDGVTGLERWQVPGAVAVVVVAPLLVLAGCFLGLHRAVVRCWRLETGGQDWNRCFQLPSHQQLAWWADVLERGWSVH